MTVAVLGAGAWGTTLATILARDGGRDVVLWARDPAQAADMGARRENRKYLAGIRIPDQVATAFVHFVTGCDRSAPNSACCRRRRGSPTTAGG